MAPHLAARLRDRREPGQEEAFPKQLLAFNAVPSFGHGRQDLESLPWAHTVFGNLETWLRGTFHGVSPKHLQRYLDEVSYRFDHRWRVTELFAFVLRRVARGRPLRYRLLVAEGTA